MVVEVDGEGIGPTNNVRLVGILDDLLDCCVIRVKVAHYVVECGDGYTYIGGCW